MPNQNADNTLWAIEREIVLSKVINAPRELVFAAWADPQHLVRWFGPPMFTLETLECDVRVGGKFRFVMSGHNGLRYDNRMHFLEIKKPDLLVFDHGSDKDDDPHRFRVTITFDEQSDKKTVITLRQLHPSKEQREATIGFGAVEIGYQTLDKLGRYLLDM